MLTDYDLTNCVDNYFYIILKYIEEKPIDFKILGLCEFLKCRGFKKTSRVTVQNKLNSLMCFGLVCLSNSDPLHPLYKINYNILKVFLINDLMIKCKIN